MIFFFSFVSISMVMFHTYLLNVTVVAILSQIIGFENLY